MAVDAGASAPSRPFCAESIGKDTAAGFEKWAARRARFPPPGRAGDFFELRLTDSLGTHAVARRGFKPGDLILSETTLLHVPAVPQKLSEDLHRKFGNRGPFLGPALAVDWDGVDAEVMEATLGLFWAHPLITTKRSTLLGETRQACTDLLERNEKIRERMDVENLMRFLHIVDLNIHRDGEEMGHDRFAGIFVLGSKFSNSCAANCKWSFSDDGYLEYHAIRPIAPGDVLSFSYIGNGMSLVMGTVERRRRLGSLWFVCSCERCTGPDLARQMRCPACKSPQCMPVRDDSNAASADWAGDRALRELIPEAVTWHCAACNTESSSSEMPLQAEQELSNKVPDVLGGPPENASEDRHEAWELSDRASRELGPMHWTWMLATFAWLQKCLTELQRHPVIDFGEGELREASSAIARWFDACAPDNVEQRLSALCLAARLAQCYGTPLQLWGYDAKDPLGDSTEVAKKLAAIAMSPASAVLSAEAPAVPPLPGHVRANRQPYKAMWR